MWPRNGREPSPIKWLTSTPLSLTVTEDEMLAALAANDSVWEDFEKAKKHDLPHDLLTEAGKGNRLLPVIVWSRLYMDLEPYLAERNPGWYGDQLLPSASGRKALEGCISSRGPSHLLRTAIQPAHTGATRGFGSNPKAGTRADRE